MLYCSGKNEEHVFWKSCAEEHKKRRHKIDTREKTWGVGREMMEFYKVSSVRYANHSFHLPMEGPVKPPLLLHAMRSWVFWGMQ